VWIDRNKDENKDFVHFDFIYTDDPPGEVSVRVWKKGDLGLRAESVPDKVPFEWKPANKYYPRGYILWTSVTDLARVTFSPLHKRTVRQTFRFTITIHGAVVGKGSFLVKARHFRRKKGHLVRCHECRQVWDDTDEFFNYCIKEGKELFSSGGRLYCWRGTVSYVGGRRARTEITISRLHLANRFTIISSRGRTR
jgi:hypothetical protein